MHRPSHQAQNVNMGRGKGAGQVVVGGARRTDLLLDAAVGHWNWTWSPVEEVLVGGHLARLHGGSGSSQLTNTHTHTFSELMIPNTQLSEAEKWNKDVN